jgi:hypothetical protein
MTGRNESCPCGSGKKYKKCCLDKDREERRVQQEAQKLTPLAGNDSWLVEPEERDEDSYMEELYARFETADFAERLAMFQEVVNHQKGVAGDLADLFALLQQAATDDTSRRELNCSLVELRRQRPDCWKQYLGFFVNSFLTNALATGDTSEIGAYFLEASKQPERDIDTYRNTIDMLAYHGRHRELTEGLRLALPQIEKAGGLMPWVAGDIASQLIDCEILAWVEADHTGADFTALQRVVEKIQPKINREILRSYAEHLAGWHKPATEIRRDEKNRLDLDQLSFLTAAFAGYLGRECGVAGITGLLEAREIAHYLAEREAGNLKTSRRPGIVAKNLRGAKKRKGAVPHALLPDPETLDRFFAKQLHLLTHADHAVAALALSLPAWCDFLKAHNLLESDADTEQLHLLTPVIRTLVQIIEKSSDDPTLAPALRNLWPDIS